MSVVYAHYRKTDNEIFYIGIGVKATRPYSYHNRNRHWKNVVNKHGHTVEILCDDLTWEQACEAEIFFISFYGRKDLGKGPLLNLTDGGDGTTGHVQSEEAIRKRVSKIDYVQRTKKINYHDPVRKAKIKAARGECLFNKDPEKRARGAANTDYKKIHTKEAHQKVADKLSKAVIQYDLDGNFIKEWKSINDARYKLNAHQINKCCINEYGSSGGYMWRYKTENYPLNIDKYYVVGKTKPILQYDKSKKFIKEWRCAKEAGDFYKMKNYRNIISCCNNMRNNCGGFIWEYKNESILNG